jgi:lipopolysaccharide/colanic/teichoic acid biosynthesis glycosyltransferase
MTSTAFVPVRADADAPAAREEAAVSAERARFLRAKRAAEAAIAGASLVVVGPLVFVLAAAVETTSRGSAFVSRWHVGLNGRLFRMHRFRTEHVVDDGCGVPAWAKDDPARVTSVGRVLRATRLERLPEIFNVLRGDMSFVGPRPERPAFVRESTSNDPRYAERLSVRPGMVGLAQLCEVGGDPGQAARRRLANDLGYARRMSWRLDAAIVRAAMGRALRRRDDQPAR